jgi:hypothetical protein
MTKGYPMDNGGGLFITGYKMQGRLNQHAQVGQVLQSLRARGSSGHEQASLWAEVPEGEP